MGISTRAKITQDRINYAIKSLEDALVKCQSVDYNDDARIDQTPAFVVGYTSSTIKNALIDLENAVKSLT